MANEVISNRKRHKGRIRQLPIYLGKCFRMFFYMDDWRVIPMAAIIAALVALVASNGMFKTMEGTGTGALALTCICIWNGFFNSIQVVCRERDIVKREHRSGMHISSYLFAHMIYQAFLCLLQTGVTIVVCIAFNMEIPITGFITPHFYLDMSITIFLITYASDMTSLAVSCISRNTTAAMTIMPFMLIFELLFSGRMFSIGENMAFLTNLSIAKWGIRCFCAQADFNSLPMTSMWNQISKFQHYDVDGREPVSDVIKYMEATDRKEDFLLWCGENSQVEGFSRTVNNIVDCWAYLVIFIIVFAILSIVFLEFVDRDKR